MAGWFILKYERLKSSEERGNIAEILVGIEKQKGGFSCLVSYRYQAYEQLNGRYQAGPLYYLEIWAKCSNLYTDQCELIQQSKIYIEGMQYLAKGFRVQVKGLVLTYKSLQGINSEYPQDCLLQFDIGQPVHERVLQIPSV